MKTYFFLLNLILILHSSIWFTQNLYSQILLNPIFPESNKMVAGNYLASSKPFKNFPSASFTDTLLKKSNNCCFNTWFFGTSLTPLLSLVSYNSFLLNEKVKFKGIKIGFEIGKKARIGFGSYKLDHPIELSPMFNDLDTIKRKLSFEYYNFFFDYVLYKDFRWEVALPFSFGKAKGDIDTVSAHFNNPGKIKSDSTLLSTIGVDLEYRFIPWLGIGGGIGFRNAFAPTDIRQKISAPYYSFKLKIFLGYLFKTIFRRKKLEEERKEYQREKEERRKKIKEWWDKNEKENGKDKVEGTDKPENKNDY